MVTFPKSIIAGEAFTVRINVSVASASLAIRGPSKADLSSEPNSAPSLLSADSSEWLPGDYQFELWGTNSSGGKQLIGRDSFTVTASIVGMEALGIKSLAQKNVDALEAYLTSIGDPNADASVLRYKINNRELFNYPISDIQRLLGYWRRRLVREQREALGLRGRPGIRVFI